jgi:hypothetical protein
MAAMTLLVSTATLRCWICRGSSTKVIAADDGKSTRDSIASHIRGRRQNAGRSPDVATVRRKTSRPSAGIKMSSDRSRAGHLTARNQNRRHDAGGRQRGGPLQRPAMVKDLPIPGWTTATRRGARASRGGFDARALSSRGLDFRSMCPDASGACTASAIQHLVAPRRGPRSGGTPPALRERGTSRAPKAGCSRAPAGKAASTVSP